MCEMIPRPEYPRPQFVREKWINLNGEWEYSTDRCASGEARGLFNPNSTEYNEKITVPFCRESVLSGIGDTDFCEHVWYRKKITFPEDWKSDGDRVLLNIGACDYHTYLWVNDRQIGDHVGGYVSFSFDITDALTDGENVIIIKADDYTRSGKQPTGKQSQQYASNGCMYRRTTGIWQTVWLECVPADYIEYTRYFTDNEKCRLTVEAHTVGAEGLTVSAVVFYDGMEVGRSQALSYGGKAVFDVELSERHLWQIGEGNLYDVVLGYGNDLVRSYFGMRKIECRNGIMYLNGKPVFQRLVLDQGFYPDGIYTAPTVEELYRDVDRSLAMGFNGARLHQKVFEPLFLSYCDRKGYIVWGEHANWGLEVRTNDAYDGFLPEWSEIMKRDFNHPAIIGWCPINESDREQNKRFMRTLAELTKAYDTTRLFIDASGWTHGDYLSDIYDLHDYEQDPVKFAEHLEPLKEGKLVNAHWIFGKEHEKFVPVTFVSEYGGTWWADGKTPGWGYGKAPESSDEFLARFKALTDVLLDHPKLGALCYTQLTDVEQEVNGLYTFDRQPKFPPELFAEILRRPAAIEMEAETAEEQ